MIGNHYEIMKMTLKHNVFNKPTFDYLYDHYKKFLDVNQKYVNGQVLGTILYGFAQVGYLDFIDWYKILETKFMKYHNLVYALVLSGRYDEAEYFLI